MTQVGLLSVNVGRPAYLGQHRGHPVESGIAKKPVGTPTLWLDTVNLEGDGQADLRVHGGPDKAVYAYPSEHFAAWSAELGEDLGPSAFGENLTIQGWLEDTVCVGDRWQWGDAVLEVCQPRWPCFKLALHRKSGRVGPRMRETGRTGWYLRVLQTGRVPVAGPITVAERSPAGVSIRDVHEARRQGLTAARLSELLAIEALGDEWKEDLVERFRHAGDAEP
ncbi:MAG: MOSC domain-containing protein [Acidimicrobiales bacterium]